MKISINKALVLGKTVRERINDLKSLRQNVSSRRTIFGDTREITEPTYDIKELDKRILKLQSIGFSIETAIKEANNIVTVDLEDDIQEELFKSLV